VSITNTLPAGKLVAASMDSSGGAFTGLVVTAQSGFSPSARTLIGEVVVQPEGNITNFAATIYVAGDTVVFTAFNAATTASVTAVAHVIVDR
jgi:hypothetical protein